MFTDMRHLVWYFALDRVFVAKAMKSAQANYRVLRVACWRYSMISYKIQSLDASGLGGNDGKERYNWVGRRFRQRAELRA